MRRPGVDRLRRTFRVPQKVPALRRRPHHPYRPRRALRPHFQAEFAVLPRQIHARRAADPALKARGWAERDRGPRGQIRASKTSPISSVDVARAVAAILDDPAPHIGHIYNLTGPESADLDHYARVFSEALGRTIRYRDASTSEWSEKLRAAGLPEHVVHHLTVMTELHKQGRYDRMSEEYLKLTGEMPTSMADFVKLHATEFTRL
jgi:hypothetical protein